MSKEAQKNAPKGRNAGSKVGSLYEEAADVLAEISRKGTSGGLRTIIYNAKSTRRSDPRQLYALVSSTLKFRDLLAAVIKASGMMKTEYKAVSIFKSQKAEIGANECSWANSKM